ncbi:MAG: primosomal protein N' [Spirochaetaceae bacterium]|nr:MAG: primosomal protein N' [Spirochaetaceae bacterium]
MSKYCELSFNLPLQQAFTYACPDCVPEVGMRVEASFRGRELEGFVTGISDIKPAGNFRIKPITRIVDREPVFTEKQVALAAWTASMYLCSPGEVLSLMVPGGRREKDAEGSWLSYDTDEYRITQLSDEQMAALAAIKNNSNPFHYVYGITGSGKTAVFLRYAKEVFEQGKGVIYLVPEISLTHQVLQAFRTEFGEDIAARHIAVLHSGLSPSVRLAEWRRVLKGDARLVIGVRSAVFAPVPSLGLIVIDEEHENTYKAGATPRYHARQVAMHRVQDEGAKLLMGSATPSVEAWHSMETGKLAHSKLKTRPAGGILPKVTVINMAGETGPFSKQLLQAIQKAKSAGKQSILFLNRRGFSYSYRCNSCGFEHKCSHCSVSLTYHKQRNILVCHYCGLAARPVSSCPKCGSLDTGYLGFGTELVEEEISRLFPDYSIQRVDTDTVKKKKLLEETIRGFKEGKTDILLGTQMVAKGLNVRGVSLVGIVLADTSLMLPDFRAAERTFSLIVQVGGRAGRYAAGGEVMIQTFRPEHEAIRLASQMRIEEFYAGEMEMRKELGFPPFTRLIRLVFRGRDKTKVHKTSALFSQNVRKQLEERNEAGAEVLGPAECPIGVIARNHRFQIIFRSASFGPLVSSVKTALWAFKAPLGVYIEVDVDPMNLM